MPQTILHGCEVRIFICRPNAKTTTTRRINKNENLWRCTWKYINKFYSRYSVLAGNGAREWNILPEACSPGTSTDTHPDVIFFSKRSARFFHISTHTSIFELSFFSSIWSDWNTFHTLLRTAYTQHNTTQTEPKTASVQCACERPYIFISMHKCLRLLSESHQNVIYIIRKRKFTTNDNDNAIHGPISVVSCICPSRMKMV